MQQERAGIRQHWRAFDARIHHHRRRDVKRRLRQLH